MAYPVNRRKWTLRAGRLVASCCLAICLQQAARAEMQAVLETPESTIDSLHQGLVAVAQDTALGNVAQRFEALLPLVRATHDFSYIAQLTVRRQWPEFTEDQRADFIAAFERLSVMTYAARFASVTSETFELLSAGEENPERRQVFTLIHPADGESVSLDYMLQSTGEGWRIINIVAGGVSDLALKRSEYRRILGSGSVDGLIRHIEEQAASLE